MFSNYTYLVRLPQIKPIFIQPVNDTACNVLNKATPCASAPCMLGTFANTERESTASNDTDRFCTVSRTVALVSGIQYQIRYFTALQIRVDRLERAVMTNMSNLVKLRNNIYRLVYKIDEMNGYLLQD